jgi:hypothetical protein
MKKIIFSTVIFLSSISVFAQSEIRPNIVKLNALGALLHSVNLGYERGLNAQSSVVFLPSFALLKSGDLKYQFFGLGAEYRYYFSGTAPKGAYVAPGASYLFGSAKYTNFNNNSEKTTASGFTVKGVAGYQWIFGGNFVLDLNGGIQYLKLNLKDNSGDFANQNAASGILPALSASIGFNF